MKKHFRFTAPLLFFCLTLTAQKNVDSLFREFGKPQSDTSLIKILHDIGWEKRNKKADTAFLLMYQAITIAKKTNESKEEIVSKVAFKNWALCEFHLGSQHYTLQNNDSAQKHFNTALEMWKKMRNWKVNNISATAARFEANTRGNLGNIYYVRADYHTAYQFYSDAIKIAEENEMEDIVGRQLGNIANVYLYQSDFPKALEYYFKALKINERLNPASAALNLGNIGTIYGFQNDRKKALEYFFKAAELHEKNENYHALCATINNIGLIYEKSNEYSKAIAYFNKALALEDKIKNEEGKMTTYCNLGTVFQNMGDSAIENHLRDSAIKTIYPKSIEYSQKAISIAENFGDIRSIAICRLNIGLVLKRMKKYKESEISYKKALVLAQETESKDIERDIERALHKLYSEIGNIPLAYDHYMKYISARDSIDNDIKKRDQFKTEVNFEFEKKEAAAKAEQDKKDAVAAAESTKQKIVTLLISAVLVLVLIFAIFVLRSLRITRRQKIVIEEKSRETELQKEEIEEKNKDILDSIRYAKRIQVSLLPTEKYISRVLMR